MEGLWKLGFAIIGLFRLRDDKGRIIASRAISGLGGLAGATVGLGVELANRSG